MLNLSLWNENTNNMFYSRACSKVKNDARVWGVRGIILSKTVHNHVLLVLGNKDVYAHREITSLVPRYARHSVPFRECITYLFSRPGRARQIVAASISGWAVHLWVYVQ